MQETEEQSQIEINSENIKEFITSKALKQRIAAYKKVSEYPELIGIVQNETLAIALEPAILALLNYEGNLTNEDISNLYLQFTQPKPTIKNSLSSLIDKVFLNDRNNVLIGLLSNVSHKNPKVVLGCVTKIRNIIENNNEYFINNKNTIIQTVCPQLETILSSVDKDVKAEGILLCLAIYRLIFDQINVYLEKVKPILLKELAALFSTVEIPAREVKISELPFDSSDWKERLTALTFLKENIGNMTNKQETHSILLRKTRDANLQVVTAAIETIRNGKITQADCIRGTLERFKDKKAPLNQLIKETVEKLLPDVNILIDCLENSNPQIKVGILECLRFYPKIVRTSEIAKSLEDSSPEVRKAATETLENADDLSGLTEAQLKKLQKKKVEIKKNECANSEVKTRVSSNTGSVPRMSNSSCIGSSNTESAARTAGSSANGTVTNTGTVTRTSGSPDAKCSTTSNLARTASSPVKVIDHTKFEFSLSPNEKLKICEDFTSRYSFLLEKDWNKRLEAINQSVSSFQQENPKKLVEFLHASKETNFHIFRAFLGILATFPDLSQVRTPLISFLNSKITETKLSESIAILYGKLDQGEFLNENFVYCLKNNKTGKKFLTFLEFFEKFVRKTPQIESFLEDFKVIGVPEKRALSNFVDLVRKRDSANNEIIDIKNGNYDIEFRGDNTTSTKVNTAIANPFTATAINTTSTKVNTATTTINTAATKVTSATTIKTDTSSNSTTTFSSDSSNVHKNYINIDSDQSVPTSFFTPQFLQLFNSDLNRAVTYLETLDLLRFSTAIISLYCTHSIPSTYFNSLILHLITSRCILNENEAKVLVFHLITHDMTNELELMDRIFPATKLYRLYRSIPAKGLREIQNLIGKYKCLKDLKDFEIENCIKDNEDFIGFSIEVDRLMKMKVELRQKYDEPVAATVLKELSECLANSEDQGDLNSLEDSMVIEAQCSELTVVDSAFASPAVILAPSVAEVDSVLSHCDNFEIPEGVIEDSVLHSQIEYSLENISISTTPVKRKKNRESAEDFVERLSTGESEEALTGLVNLLSTEPQSLLQSCNTIISSLTRLLVNNPEGELRALLLNALVKFTANSEICSGLRYEILVDVNTILIPAVKDNNVIADILINLCLNCDLQILRVYFDLLNNTDEILLKLIWRHSKRVYSSPESTAVVVRIIDSLYCTKREFLASSENIVLKVCLLHLKECVSAFSDNIKEFGIGPVTAAIVKLLITSRDLNLEEIRGLFKE